MRLADRIDRANAEAARRLTASRGHWVDVRPLRDVVPDLGAFELTHSGPPLLWREMGGAHRGAAVAAVLSEGWAFTAEDALAMLDRGEVTFRPDLHGGGAGALAGVCSPRTPVCVVEERAPGDRHGARAWAPVESDRYDLGAYDAEAVGRRRSWRDALAPELARAVAAAGGVSVDELIARSLLEGDELVHRTVGADALLTAAVGPSLVCEGLARALALAAAKLACDAACGVEDSTVVTAMARNGARSGVRLSGTGDQWFTAPAPSVVGVLREGVDEGDTGRDVGDSSMGEAAGLGAFALAGAPAMHARYGARGADGRWVTRDMGEVTVARHPRYGLPAPDVAGVPAGIDARRVLDAGMLPVIGAQIPHRSLGHAGVGVGLAKVPLECFTKAIEHFAGERGMR